MNIKFFVYDDTADPSPQPSREKMGAFLYWLDIISPPRLKTAGPRACECQTVEHLKRYLATGFWSCPCRCPEHSDAHLVFRRTS